MNLKDALCLSSPLIRVSKKHVHFVTCAIVLRGHWLFKPNAPSHDKSQWNTIPTSTGIIMAFTSPLFWARMITQTSIWYSAWRDSCYFIHAMKNSWFPDCPKFRLARYYTLYHGLYVSCLSEKIHSATIGFSSRPFGLDQRRWKTKWRPPRFTGNRANYSVREL